jgi:hypothetical protein
LQHRREAAESLNARKPLNLTVSGRYRRMCQEFADCPYWTEIASLRRYKRDASRRISELESLLAQNRSSPCRSCPYSRHRDFAPEPQPKKVQCAARINQLETDVCEWQKFAHFLLEELRPLTRFSGDFPCSDSEVQRFILTDLLRRALPGPQPPGQSSDDYQSLLEKYRESQLKLREVTAKCNSMLAMMSDHRLSSPTRRSFHFDARHYLEELDEFD